MPRFRSISFPGEVPFALRFKDGDPLFEPVAKLTSARIREILDCRSSRELKTRAAGDALTPHAFVHARLLAALGAEERRPYSGWPAGSVRRAEAARTVIRASGARTALVPFARRGTYVAAAAQEKGVKAFYVDSNPVTAFLTEARLAVLALNAPRRSEIAADLERIAAALPRSVARTTADPLLVSSLPHQVPQMPPDAAELLAKLRTEIDTLQPLEAALVEGAVVEALPRTPGEMSSTSILRAVRDELSAIARFVREEPPLLSLPQRMPGGLRDASAVQSVLAECVIAAPPPLHRSPQSNAALWFLGVRVRGARARVSIELPDEIEEALAAIRDARAAQAARRYFSELAHAFTAIANHVTAWATLALEARHASAGGADIDITALLGAILRNHGFERTSTTFGQSAFVVFRR